MLSFDPIQALNRGFLRQPKKWQQTSQAAELATIVLAAYPSLHQPMTALDRLRDLRWLLSSDGRAALAAIQDSERLPELIALRKRYARGRAEWLYETLQLRRRARAKFDTPDRLFLTRRALQQATGDPVARWKSARFAGFECVADLCCGIGGDLRHLACTAERVVGIERDQALSWMARANLAADREAEARVGEFAVICGDANDVRLERVDAWHIDPDRRPGGRRTIAVEQMVPGGAQIERFWTRQPNGAVKLAPATEVPSRWSAAVEACWVAVQGECKELVLFGGDLARRPGRRVAVQTDSGGAHAEWAVAVSEWSGPELCPRADRVAEAIYEAVPSLLASGLAPARAARDGLQRITRAAGFATGALSDLRPWWTAYAVRQVVPLDLRKIKQVVRGERLRVEGIKQRGVKLDISRWQRALSMAGTQIPAVVIATRLRDRPIGVIAHRIRFS